MESKTFLFQAFIYLAAAVLTVPLAKKLGLGSVLGYLLAGILIGPAVFDWVGSKGQDIMHFAEFGVVMMLFIIGLELEPELLWKMRKSIVGLGGLQVLITATLVAIGAYALNLPWPSALAIGMTLSLSSTAIVLQTLNEKGLMKTSGGQSAFSVLLFQDVAVIPMLALFPLLAVYPLLSTSGNHTDTWTEGLAGWLQTLIVLGSVAAIILAGRFLMKPLFRIIASTNLREIFTASALLLVVGIAVLMTRVGLSPALGTFVAGVVLANSEYRHELESDIEPFKGLLLGLFFIAVGASIDFNRIMEQPGLIIGLVIALMALKAIVLLFLGRVFRLSLDQNLLFSLSLCQVGEFAFVLLSFSLQQGVLQQHTADILIAVVAISMAFTPLIMLFNEKVFMPRVGTLEKEKQKRQDDDVDERNAVIVAGFGHFGNTVGRFLRANGIEATYLDIDSDRVDLLRKMGLKVYYGDATRHDLLRSAGAEHARLILIAIDDPEKRLALIETVKKHFPQLRMLVRASNRNDAYDLMNAGMLHVYRESMDTALRMGKDALVLLGHRAYRVHRMAQTFFKYDERVLKDLASIRDKDEYIIRARGHIEELERLLKSDELGDKRAIDRGWDEEGLLRDAREEQDSADRSSA